MKDTMKIDRQTYLFSIKHVTKELGKKLIYGISLNQDAYFFSKTMNIADCKQIDSQPPLNSALFMELCTIITEMELAYFERPDLEMINKKIVVILSRIRLARAPLI